MTNDNQQQGGGSHGGHRPNAGRKRLVGEVYRVRIVDQCLINELEDTPTPGAVLSELATSMYYERGGIRTCEG